MPPALTPASLCLHSGLRAAPLCPRKAACKPAASPALHHTAIGSRLALLAGPTARRRGVCRGGGGRRQGTRVVLLSSVMHQGGRLDMTDLQVAAGTPAPPPSSPDQAPSPPTPRPRPAPRAVPSIIITGTRHVSGASICDIPHSDATLVQARRRYNELQSYADSKLAMVMAAQDLQDRFLRWVPPELFFKSEEAGTNTTNNRITKSENNMGLLIQRIAQGFWCKRLDGCDSTV